MFTVIYPRFNRLLKSSLFVILNEVQDIELINYE
jgi:hypothetical protein